MLRLLLVFMLSLAALAPRAEAATVAPDGTSSYLFAWHGAGDGIDLILPGGGSSWSLVLSDPSEITISVRDVLWPDARFSLTGTDGAILPWSHGAHSGLFNSGLFKGVYEDVLEPGTYEFGLKVDPLSIWAGVGRADFSIAALSVPAVPLPPALPAFAALLLGAGALLRRRASPSARQGRRLSGAG